MSVASVITVISQRVARIDAVHVCQFNVADMAHMGTSANEKKPLMDADQRK